MMARTLMALAVVGVALAGCTGPDAGAGGAGGAGDLMGVLRGVVVDQAIRPLDGAEVRISGSGGERNATTGDDGLFLFEGLPAGAWVVDVSKPFYSAQRQAVTVRVEEEPPTLRVELVLETGILPFASQHKWEGFIECSASIGNWCGIANLYPCIVQSQVGQACTRVSGDQSFSNLQGFFTDLQRIPTWLQMEAYWESTQSISQRLAIRYAATSPEEWDQFSYGPVLASALGPSPLIAMVNATAMGEAELGLTRGLTTELFHGPPDAAPNIAVPGVCSACEQFLGLAVNQRVTIVYTAFYGYAPPEGWSFIASGSVPGP
jgi:hypothetical protein